MRAGERGERKVPRTSETRVQFSTPVIPRGFLVIRFFSSTVETQREREVPCNPPLPKKNPGSLRHAWHCFPQHIASHSIKITR